MHYVKNKRTGELRIGCNAEVRVRGSKPFQWHVCGAVPVIKRTLEFLFEGKTAYTYLYYCKLHERRAYEPAAGCYLRFHVDKL